MHHRVGVSIKEKLNEEKFRPLASEESFHGGKWWIVIYHTHLTIDKNTFGWSIIEKMYDREVTRIKNGQCARIPKLKQSHIHRDSWTRLNVLPSKVMQVI